MTNIDWMGDQTMETNGGSTALYLARDPLRPLDYAYFSRSGNKRAFRHPGMTWDHFRSTVGPFFIPVIFGVKTNKLIITVESQTRSSKRALWE